MKGSKCRAVTGKVWNLGYTRVTEEGEGGPQGCAKQASWEEVRRKRLRSWNRTQDSKVQGLRVGQRLREEGEMP